MEAFPNLGARLHNSCEETGLPELALAVLGSNSGVFFSLLEHAVKLYILSFLCSKIIHYSSLPNASC